MAKAKKKKKKTAKKASASSSGVGPLVIVESPTKAKTIRKFLPKNYHVEACVGHIRDLPASAREIPEKFKKKPWANLGINVDDNFTPLYIIPPGKIKVIRHLREKLKKSSELILATDEDREGESISHHLAEVLQPKVPVKRMVFDEITQSAITNALNNFREVDIQLVQAQEARRVLDRLVGYSLSPLIWKKIAYGLSAGRVQSVAVRIIVEREKERMLFKKGIYCGILAQIKSSKGEFEAKLNRFKSKKVATGKDFDEHTGKIVQSKAAQTHLLLKNEADALQKSLNSETWTVKAVNEKPITRRPVPPFITSTLQQDANRKLGLSARDTMRTAQKLYERGFISYMRTDSVHMSQEAISSVRSQVQKLYGKEFLSPEPRQFTSKSKLAQEAHEAIRPTTECPLPSKTGLIGQELALYELIWKRTIATQMADAKQLSVSIGMEAGESEFQATGTRIIFAGFLRAYVEGTDDAEAALSEREVILPQLKEGDKVDPKELKVTEHETKPPSRFTEAALVQTLEREGVGRPSTYASIITTIINRQYVRRVGNALVPTFTAFAVHKLLFKHFNELVDLKFTAEMEGDLDQIAAGKRDYVEFLKLFYLDNKTGLRALIATREKEIDPDDARTIDLENFKDVEFRVGRFGPYLVKKDPETGEVIRASIPEDIAPADIKRETIDQIIQLKKDGPPSLGDDPVTGKKVYLMTGRYGPYLQLGEIPLEAEEEAVKEEDKAEAEEDAKGAKGKKKKTKKKKAKKKKVKKTKPKVKRAMLPKDIDLKNITFKEALAYMNLPRTLGDDSEGHSVKAGLGRFGPFVMKTGGGLEKPEYRSIKKGDHVLEVDLKRALEIFAEPRVRGKRRASVPLRVLGEHPKDKKPIEIYDGPYGLYAKCGKTNASLPKETKPEDVTLEQAIELIEARKK